MTPDAADANAAPAKPARPRLAGLFLGQFTTTFNDNAFKLIVAFLAIRAIPGYASMDKRGQEDATQWRTTMAFVAFTVPLVLVSLPAGALADRRSKRTLLVWREGGEWGLMLAAAAAL